MAVVIVVPAIIPSLMEMKNIAEHEASVKHWRDAGYQLIVDKYGTTCPTKQYQMWDETCNFDIPLEKDPASLPSDSTIDWLIENEIFNEELKKNPTQENCDLAKANIVAIQETVDILPSGDANAKVYIKGINMYQQSIDNYCK